MNFLLQLLSENDKLAVDNGKLVSFSGDKILTPVGDVLPLLLNHVSPLKDQFVDEQQLQEFFQQLSKDNVLVRINHIGFCYKVASLSQEKNRLTKLMSKSNTHLYLEPANDGQLWFFIGNTETWENAMIELVPVEKSKDKWIDYSLPHIQIDIDTTLTEEEIKQYVSNSFGVSVQPYSIKIDGVVFIVRNRLGTVDGVNITLDLATKSRNVKYQRQGLLQRIC